MARRGGEGERGEGPRKTRVDSITSYIHNKVLSHQSRSDSVHALVIPIRVDAQKNVKSNQSGTNYH